MFELAKKFINRLLLGHASKSYSQEGEDMILNRIFAGNKTGFYVDVGAHHPKRFSNTYAFYKQGWSGINIDAMPGSMLAFNRARKRDINIEMPISDIKQKLVYYMFNEPALNGFSKEISESRDGLRDYKIVATKEIETNTLADVLSEYLPKNQQIDFMSIDVEGLDLQVLRSNDWARFSPHYLLVEILGTSYSEMHDSEVYQFLNNLNYELFAKTFNTCFFRLNKIKS